MSGLGTYGGNSPSAARQSVGGASGGVGSTLAEEARKQRYESPEGGLSYRSAVGEFSIDTATASGTQTVTGLKFKPRNIIFFYAQDQADEFGIGVDDGTFAKTWAAADGFTAGTWREDGSNSVRLIESSVNEYGGKVTSFNIDGFTVTWVRQGTPTGTMKIFYLALA